MLILLFYCDNENIKENKIVWYNLGIFMLSGNYCCNFEYLFGYVYDNKYIYYIKIFVRY